MPNPSDAKVINIYEDALRAVEDLADHEQTPSYHDVSKAALEMLDAIVIFALCSPNPKLALWQAAYGMGLPACEGMGMNARADLLGFGRAALSKGAKEFQRARGLPMSEYMRDSAGSCAEARERQLSESNL